MTIKTYARANTVPDGRDYITPGKAYLVERLWGFGGGQPSLKLDGGEVRDCLWRGCAFLDGGDWERIEIDEPEYVGSRFQLLTVRELEADLASLEVALQAKRAEEAAQMIDDVL